MCWASKGTNFHQLTKSKTVRTQKTQSTFTSPLIIIPPTLLFCQKHQGHFSPSILFFFLIKQKKKRNLSFACLIGPYKRSKFHGLVNMSVGQFYPYSKMGLSFSFTR